MDFKLINYTYIYNALETYLEQNVMPIDSKISKIFAEFITLHRHINICPLRR